MRLFVTCKAWLSQRPQAEFIPEDCCFTLQMTDQPVAHCPACEQFCSLMFDTQLDEPAEVPSQHFLVYEKPTPKRSVD